MEQEQTKRSAKSKALLRGAPVVLLTRSAGLPKQHRVVLAIRRLGTQSYMIPTWISAGV